MPQYAPKYTRCRNYFTQTAKTVEHPIVAQSTLYRANINAGGRIRSHSQHTTLFAATTFTARERTTLKEQENIPPKVRSYNQLTGYDWVQTSTIARVHALHQEMATWYEHTHHRMLSEISHSRSPQTFYTSSRAQAIYNTCLSRDFGRQRSGLRNASPATSKKLLRAKTTFLGSGDQKEELRLCRNPAPEGKTRKGQKSAVLVGKGLLVSLYVSFSCFKIPEGLLHNLCCRKKRDHIEFDVLLHEM